MASEKPNEVRRMGFRPDQLRVRLNLAARLLAHNARPRLVERATALPWQVVTGLSAGIHGTHATRGPFRASCENLLLTRSVQVLASAFAVRFLAHAGPRPRQVSADHWLAAYEEWLAVTSPTLHSRLSVNDAWRIAEDLRIGAWCDRSAPGAAWMEHCPDCERRFLDAGESMRLRGCPHCALLRFQRRPAMDAEPLGDVRAAAL
jgi:hypothetical protein